MGFGLDDGVGRDGFGDPDVGADGAVRADGDVSAEDGRIGRIGARISAIAIAVRVVIRIVRTDIFSITDAVTVTVRLAVG